MEILTSCAFPTPAPPSRLNSSLESSNAFSAPTKPVRAPRVTPVAQAWASPSPVGSPKPTTAGWNLRSPIVPEPPSPPIYPRPIEARFPVNRAFISHSIAWAHIGRPSSFPVRAPFGMETGGSDEKDLDTNDVCRIAGDRIVRHGRSANPDSQEIEDSRGAQEGCEDFP